MPEKNRHILERTIRNLPQHSPDNASWEGIENLLNQSDNTIELGKLPEHAPNKKLWKSIESELHPKSPFYYRIWFIAASLFLIFSVIIYGFYNNIQHNQKKNFENNNIKSQTSNLENLKIPKEEEKKSDINKLLSRSNSPGKNTMALSVEKNNTGSNSRKRQKINSNSHKNSNSTNNPVAIESSIHTNLQNPLKSNDGDKPIFKTIQTNLPESKVYVNQIKSIDKIKSLFISSIVIRTTLPVLKVIPEGFNLPKAFNWFIGFSYSGDKFSKTNNISDISGSSFKIRAIFEKDNFILESGPMLSFLNYDYKYDYTYHAYDITDYFVNVDSVTYNVYYDSVLHNNVIKNIYHTSMQPIYDSVSQNIGSVNTSRNTYLSIPVLFGFKKDFGRFGFIFRNGPVFIFRLNSVNVNSFDIDEQLIKDYQNKMQLLPGNFNYYYMISAGVLFHLHSRITFSVDPSIGFYGKPLVGDDKRNKTKVIGIESGILYKIN